VPCALTATVGFETTPSRLRDLRNAIRGGKRLRLNKFAVGGAAGAAVVAGARAACLPACLPRPPSSLPATCCPAPARPRPP
jgi:hypothetical protein